MATLSTLVTAAAIQMVGVVTLLTLSHCGGDCVVNVDCGHHLCCAGVETLMSTCHCGIGHASCIVVVAWPCLSHHALCIVCVSSNSLWSSLSFFLLVGLAQGTRQ